MNREDIIRMAREAGFHCYNGCVDGIDTDLERFFQTAYAAGAAANAPQPAQQQEPVAYSYTSRVTGAQGFSHHPMPRFIDADSWDIKPLYTSPPANEGLLREIAALSANALDDYKMIQSLMAERKPWVGMTYGEVLEQKKDDPIQFYRAIEAKLREKNA